MPLHQALLRMGGFPEYYLQQVNRSLSELATNYGRMTGHHITVIDFTSLTGISVVDGAIEDSARLVIYALFASLFWLFSGMRLPTKGMFEYFAYAFGACLIFELAVMMAADLLFALTASETTLLTLQQLGGIPRLLFLLVVPAVIFPSIFSLSRGRVIWTIILAVLSWGIGGLIISKIMMGAGLVIHGPGL